VYNVGMIKERGGIEKDAVKEYIDQMFFLRNLLMNDWQNPKVGEICTQINKVAPTSKEVAAILAYEIQKELGQIEADV